MDLLVYIDDTMWITPGFALLLYIFAALGTRSLYQPNMKEDKHPLGTSRGHSVEATLHE
jgi:hypothetical protein